MGKCSTLGLYISFCEEKLYEWVSPFYKKWRKNIIFSCDKNVQTGDEKNIMKKNPVSTVKGLYTSCKKSFKVLKLG